MEGNLLYILTTARCPLNCTFCMTKDLHRDEDLELNENAIQSLYNLSAVSGKVCISGEGDPLANWESILTIIKGNPWNIHYELITSSYWAKNRTALFLQELDILCQEKQSTLSYRISLDQFHAEQTERDVLSILLEIFLSSNFKNISLQIRSITGQENYLSGRIQTFMDLHSIEFSINKLNDLESKVITNQLEIKIQYKPTVNPSDFDYSDDWTIDKYIDFIEKQRSSAFHIGLLNDSIIEPLFDITINPNGDLILYGAEPYVLGNISREICNYEMIKSKVRETPELNYLVSHRFIDLINAWRKDKEKSELIDRVNNPFWIVRNLQKENLLNK